MCVCEYIPDSQGQVSRKKMVSLIAGWLQSNVEWRQGRWSLVEGRRRRRGRETIRGRESGGGGGGGGGGGEVACKWELKSRERGQQRGKDTWKEGESSPCVLPHSR